MADKPKPDESGPPPTKPPPKPATVIKGEKRGTLYGQESKPSRSGDKRPKD